MKLSNPEIVGAKLQIPEWEYDSYTEKLKRIFLFKDFKESMAFVERVAQKAQEMDHHPDILIEYSKVTLTLTTHDEGGVTEKDVQLAQMIDTL
jgi:4a-hydroxytetrahydrobiopterin dehydratase